MKEVLTWCDSDRLVLGTLAGGRVLWTHGANITSNRTVLLRHLHHSSAVSGSPRLPTNYLAAALNLEVAQQSTAPI